MLIASLVAESMQHGFVYFAVPLYSWIKVTVIKTRISTYGIHKSTVMTSLNVILIAYILFEILQVKCSQVWDALMHTDSGRLSQNFQMSPTTLQTSLTYVLLSVIDYFRNCSSNAHHVAVKMVRLNVYATIASPTTLTIIQGHKCVSNLTTF